MGKNQDFPFVSVDLRAKAIITNWLTFHQCFFSNLFTILQRPISLVLLYAFLLVEFEMNVELSIEGDPDQRCKN